MSGANKQIRHGVGVANNVLRKTNKLMSGANKQIHHGVGVANKLMCCAKQINVWLV